MKGKGAAIGTFDGLHRGHQSVVDTLIRKCEERGLEPVVVTFDRHPLALIDPEREPEKLSTDHSRAGRLKGRGVEPLVMEFNRTLQQTNASEWIQRLHDEFGVRLLVVGYDNTFGSDGVTLSLADYRELGKRAGMEIIEAPELEGISSSAIRKAVKNGEMEKAAEMLGRPYALEGTVERGNAIGRKLGYPTANLKTAHRIAIPAPGVYAGRLQLSPKEIFPAMINIGTRPTIGDGKENIIEIHAIGWTGDLYERELTVEFLKRMREEIKFDSLEELKAQLDKDREEVLKICDIKGEK